MAQEKTVTLTETQLKKLLNDAAATQAGSHIDDIAKRPYQKIVAADGQVLCYPPEEGGPTSIAGQHPDDYFGVETDDKGKAKADANGNALATKNAA